MLDKALFLISMVISFYITIRAIQHFTYSDETFSSFVNQVNTGYIEDIIIAEQCPSGYDILLNNFQWPGTFEGCGCKKDNSTYTFYTSECEHLVNCERAEETKEVNLSKWKSSNFCVRRAKMNYKEMINTNYIIPNNQSNIEQCNNDIHRVCGIIDGVGNLLCLDKQKQCPITSAIISNNITLIEEIKLNNPSSTITQLGDDNYSLIVSHSENKNNKIYNDFNIDMSTPCLNKEKHPNTEVIFDLMKNKFDLQCDTFTNGTPIVDSIYDSIDTYSYSDFLKDNNVYDTVNSVVNKFNIDISNKSISLYAKTYPGWSFQCMKYDPDTFNNFYKSSVVLNKLSFYTVIHAFVIICILVAIGICAFYFVDTFDKLFYFIVLGFIVLDLIYPIQVITNTNWLVNNLSEENGFYCGDESLNILLLDISNACMSLLYSYVAILCVAIICVIMFIFIMQAWIKPTIKEVQERLLQMRQYN